MFLRKRSKSLAADAHAGTSGSSTTPSRWSTRSKSVPTVEFESLLGLSRFRKDFSSFLRSIRCEEYILFWDDVQQFKRIRRNSTQTQIKEAIVIYQTYIADDGSHHLSLSDGVRQSVGGSVHRPFRETVSLEMFKEVENEVVAKMRDNFYPLYCTPSSQHQLQQREQREQSSTYDDDDNNTGSHHHHHHHGTTSTYYNHDDGGLHHPSTITTTTTSTTSQSIMIAVDQSTSESRDDLLPRDHAELTLSF
eukprot:TRINITY_DN5991_c0_g1_i3.p1 TRINITY_DN5991_c0_g1~~TRINITY_DN5991_c0_g1_i3.p1  ORF type:complete len:249 (+),score=55.86 TRINITY_DN5991_c0_g1_i3:159-905(+)